MASSANFTVPTAIFVAPELPSTALGMVLNNVLRQQHASLFS
jgi:non-ribosomal peptide synthetase component E (peptide arylation enzyme)